MELNSKILSRITDGREYRSMTISIAPNDNADRMVVEGYAATFNQPYTLYSERYYRVIEQIAPTAFDECDMSDVIMQYDHAGRVFARNRNGTLSVTTDNTGLKITADLGGTDIGRQLYQEIKGGYTDRMSFGFVVGEDKREITIDHENDVKTVMRTITKINKLYDVSAVSIPANDTTSISARRFANGVIEQIKAERLERANKIRKIKLMM